MHGAAPLTVLETVSGPKQARSERTLYRLLDAAEALIVEQGLAGLSETLPGGWPEADSRSVRAERAAEVAARANEDTSRSRSAGSDSTTRVASDTVGEIREARSSTYALARAATSAGVGASAS